MKFSSEFLAEIVFRVKELKTGKFKNESLFPDDLSEFFPGVSVNYIQQAVILLGKSGDLILNELPGDDRTVDAEIIGASGRITNLF